MRGFYFTTLLFFAVLQGSAQDLSAYQEGYYQLYDFVLPYRLLAPKDFSEQKRPLLIFLHGAFEKGADNQQQLIIGGKFFFAGFNQRTLSRLYPVPAMSVR